MIFSQSKWQWFIQHWFCHIESEKSGQFKPFQGPLSSKLSLILVLTNLTRSFVWNSTDICANHNFDQKFSQILNKQALKNVWTTITLLKFWIKRKSICWTMIVLINQWINIINFREDHLENGNSRSLWMFIQ